MSQYGVTLQLTNKLDKTDAKNNFASLVNGKVPASQLPSYVDDVLEYDSKNDFPKPGETDKIYVDKSTNLTYRWSSNSNNYIMIGGKDLNVVQTTGSSETDVMSQKAVTENFLNATVREDDGKYIIEFAEFLDYAAFQKQILLHNGLYVLGGNFQYGTDGIAFLIKPPAEAGRMAVEPNSNPTETSLVTVSSTGTHAYKKVSELVAAENITYPLGANNPYKSGIEYSGNDDAYIKIYSASNYIQVKRNSININSIDPININGSVYIVGDNASLHCKEYVVYTDEGGGFFKLPILTGSYYFTPAPNTAPTEPSVVVNAVDRTPTWKPISELGGGGNALKVTVW